MSQTIDIETIKDANSNISAMSLTQKWAKVFKNYALENNEELTDDPANSFNVFLHLTAQGAAKMFYEQAARKNEANESTAILPKSLINKLTSDELAGVFGFPASTTLAFCVKKSDIIDYSVVEDESTGLRRLVVNKDFTATFESYPSFTLPYNLIINAKPVSKTLDNNSDTTYNIYAYYDMPAASNDGMRSVYQIYNQYVSSREMRYQGDTYVAFFITVFQIERKEVSFYVSDPNTADTTISFDDSLVAFEVFKSKSNDNTKTLMSGFTEGNILTTSNSYNYSYDYKRNAQNFNISFSKMNDSTALSAGDTITVVVYTTKGSEGNIEFPYMLYNLNQLAINYGQDLSDKYQNAMLNIVCLAFTRDSSSSGGSDQLTLEEIRTKIINKKYSRDILISLNEIKNKANEYGLNAYKEEHDVINMYFRGVDKLVYNDMILSTGMNNFYFDLSKKDKLLKGYNYYLIEPTDVFCYNKKTKRFNYKPKYNYSNAENNLESYLQYVDEYNAASDVESVMQVSFPFYMRYENTVNPKIQIYDMDVKTTEYLSFTYYNETYALDKLDISHLVITRNPFMGSTNGTFDKDLANTYFLRFIVYTGTNTLNKIYAQCHDEDNSKNYVNSSILDDYNKQYVIFTLKMIGSASNYTYQIDPTRIKVINPDTMLTDGYIAYQAMITTNNFITDDKQIQIKGVRNTSNATLNYNVYTPVDTTVKFVLSGRFTDSDINPDLNDCIKYETESVKLVDYLTSDFGIDFDIETTIPGYETYEENIPKRYTENQYAINSDYDASITDTSDTRHYQYAIENDETGNPLFYSINGMSTPKFIIAHKSGDIIYDYTAITSAERKAGPLSTTTYYNCTDGLNGIYEACEDLISFDSNTIYYTAEPELKHKKGEYKYYNSDYSILIDLPDVEAKASVNHKLKPLATTYTGIIKNVSWINRLYFSSEDMYETIRDCYISLINRVEKIQAKLFDGGLFRAGLKRTSGNSSKYKAYILSTNSTEYLKNIALKITYRVKFKDNESIDYKKEQIINSTVSYIENLGDNNLSVDGLFEEIKAAVPDIEYINIMNINDYYNGAVQTIINDTSVTDEVLTVSQKLTTDDSGNLTFEPDITVNVVNAEED